jgi:hypothetical protein
VGKKIIEFASVTIFAGLKEIRDHDNNFERERAKGERDEMRREERM